MRTKKLSRWPWIWNRVKGPQLEEIKNVDINKRKSRVHVGVVNCIVINGVFYINNYNFRPPTTEDSYCLLLVVRVICINTIMIRA